MPKEYVEKRERGYYIAGSRVSLDTLVQAFLSGDSAETIQRAFSTLSLEEVYGGIAFYLGHREEVEATMGMDVRDLEKLIKASREKNPLLFRKLEEARRAQQLEKQR
jgi:uncharacterized protein (DUF433 family)